MSRELLEELPEQVCLSLLYANNVGRIAVVVDGCPEVMPVNYRVVDLAGAPAVVVRTRRGNVIDSSAINVAFEIDGIDPAHRSGWSVLVKGELHHVDPPLADMLRDRLESLSWLPEGNDSWLAIQQLQITGRRLHAPEAQWAFHIRGYL